MASEGFLYVIDSGDVVKVGFARDPYRRLMQINRGFHKSGVLVGFVRCTLDQERELHTVMGSYRVKGEWYPKDCKPVQYLLKHIARPKSATGDNPCELAKKICGGTLALAQAIGVSHQAVAQWKYIPAERVLAVERLTGVSRHDLRPDLYPRE
jgi:hypothetical protein